ncbi:LOW QUALITY PROTEIN: A-kinase anchor protein 12-like [Phycodurus eques]|uniref:LOW QUALITY PROTEIN: A-kinase anchor protein 12-like n=1 Tax=Phycodurus eques TaxID=693459 RepID=UPI002ACED882|nr:LOW QUALITY PROTEIN: A-kinase anchor protein 12-like [Phycodurus eques]
MGAESSVQRDIARSGEDGEDASASAAAAGVGTQGGGVLDDKPLQKNGQISSLTSLSGYSEDNTLAEVGQPDGVSVAQKEDTSETMDTIADEQAPQVNGEKVEKESPDGNEITPAEEKAAEEKPNETGEVGFKKIFRFVGFKFTLKKDKSEEKEPVKLLTVRDKDGEVVNGIDEPVKDEAATAEENSATEEKEGKTEAPNTEAEVTKDANNAETPDGSVDAAKTSDEAVKEEGAEKEGEASSPPQEAALSPFRKLFSTGLFSNLRKKSSIKRTKEEDDKEVAGEDEAAKTEEGEDNPEAEQETKEEAPTTLEKEKAEEEAPASPEEAKPEPSLESEVTTGSPTATSDETKPEEEKAEEEKAPAEVTSDSELVGSQEKVKPQGSPLKKLFTGAGLKKRSTKNKKSKKDTEAKLTESGEQAAELQSSTESTEAAKSDSGPSSPEKSGEHAVEAEVLQADSTKEAEGEAVSDGEKKKEGIVTWSSFKKLVTPKKRVKRSSESDDEVTSEKAAKSATLSSSESAPLADRGVEEETKEDKPSEDESKTDNAEEKLVSSTEEPKKKMDTSVSWEALMCMGGPKKRTRKTSDSDDEETKIEEESRAPAAEEEEKTEASAVNTQSGEGEGEGASSPEPLSSSPERESAWDTLKRMVMPKSKAKDEEKAEEIAEQVQPESEAPKDESSFSLRKFFPGLRKKKPEKQSSNESEEDSDTPAVVPLSEYDAQHEVVQEEPAEVPANTAQVSSDERAPSWIAAMVEQGDDQHDQLSDITEEAENVATPKSVDTDNAEDDTEEHVGLPPKSAERRLSMAEVAQTPPSETTTSDPKEPKCENAQVVMAAIKAELSEVPPMTTVICEDAPGFAAIVSEESEPPLEHADSQTNRFLQPHAHDEAVATCTGLGSEEIAKIVLEKPATKITEFVSVVTDALSTEVLVKEDSMKLEEATVTEDALLSVQVQQERNTEIDCAESSQSEVLEVQTAAASCEPDLPCVGIVNTLLEPQLVETTTGVINDASIDSITPTVETPMFLQNSEVTEPSVKTNKEQDLACEVVKPSEEVCVIAESVVLVSPPCVDQVATSNMSEPEDTADTSADNEESGQIEAQSVVIAQSVIQDAMDKVSEQPKKNETSAPITAVQAVMTMENEMEIAVITDTPIPITSEKPPEKPLFVTTECGTVPIEVAVSLDASVAENGKSEEGLKKAVEVNVSEEFVIEEEVVEILGESQMNNKLEAVKAELEEEEPRTEAKESHVAARVVLNTAQEVEEELVQEETVEEFSSNSPADGKGDRPASDQSESLPAGDGTPSKCAEVMAQVMEVIEEAVKEIQPASTEITPAS